MYVPQGLVSGGLAAARLILQVTLAEHVRMSARSGRRLNLAGSADLRDAGSSGTSYLVVMATRSLPMFPLGTTLLPGSVLPLYLFEPRYLKLYEDIVDDDRSFGVVLIERGVELGGDDSRFDYGCVAHMVGSATHEDGSVSIVTVGTRRLHVVEWAEPDPYPVATVELLEDDSLSESALEILQEASSHLLRLKTLFSELGADVGVEPPELADDPGTALYQMAQLAGLQALDLQRILEATTSDERARLTRDLIFDQVELVQLQLGMG